MWDFMEVDDHLISRIRREMDSDEENLLKQSEYLANIYTDADTGGKQMLDDAFICLCGYGLGTLIKRMKDDNTE